MRNLCIMGVLLFSVICFGIAGCGKKEPAKGQERSTSNTHTGTGGVQHPTSNESALPAEGNIDQMKETENISKTDHPGSEKTASDKPVIKAVPEKTPEQIEAEKKAAAFAKEWELVFEDDFSDADFKERWDCVDGTWSVENGELVGKGEAAHIAILKKDIRGDVRIEFDVHINSDFLNDVSCFISAKSAEPKIKTYGTGYLLQYGGYTNTKNDIMRDGFPMIEEESSPLKKGVTYHMAAQRKGTWISYSINGGEVLKAEDTNMLDSPDHVKLGLYAWGGDNYYDNVKIYIPK